MARELALLKWLATGPCSEDASSTHHIAALAPEMAAAPKPCGEVGGRPSAAGRMARPSVHSSARSYPAPFTCLLLFDEYPSCPLEEHMGTGRPPFPAIAGNLRAQGRRTSRFPAIRGWPEEGPDGRDGDGRDGDGALLGGMKDDRVGG